MSRELRFRERSALKDKPGGGIAKVMRMYEALCSSVAWRPVALLHKCSSVDEPFLSFQAATLNTLLMGCDIPEWTGVALDKYICKVAFTPHATCRPMQATDGACHLRQAVDV